MIKSFNQSIAGLSLTKAKSFIRASFLSGRPEWIGSLVAGFVVVGALLLLLNPVAADSASQDNKHKLHLRVKFVDNRQLGAAVGGGFFTWGGTLARPESPDEKIGTFGVLFVRTTPATTPSTVGTETLLHGTMRLADGLIAFTGLLLPEDSVADGNGVKSRIGPITGGTGAYWNARGQIDHQTAANGDQDFIITFVGN